MKLLAGIFGKLEDMAFWLDKDTFNLSSFVNAGGATIYTTLNQVQIFSAMKSIDFSEVTLDTHLIHSFIIA